MLLAFYCHTSISIVLLNRVAVGWAVSCPAFGLFWAQIRQDICKDKASNLGPAAG